MLTTDNSLILAIDFQVRMMPSIKDNVELARKAAVFLEGCRILGVPIVTTQQYTKGLGETIPEVKEALGEFEPVDKITFSCCGNSDFRVKVTQAERNSILVMGVEAHICVQQTVLDLMGGGYYVYVIADCIGSRFETDRRYAESLMTKAGAVFTTYESVLFEILASADHPKRKEISNLVK